MLENDKELWLPRRLMLTQTETNADMEMSIDDLSQTIANLTSQSFNVENDCWSFSTLTARSYGSGSHAQAQA